MPAPPIPIAAAAALVSSVTVLIGVKERCVGDGDGDDDLVEALRRADRDATDRLVERYGEPVYRLAMRITGVTEEAEQAAEDALWRAAREIHLLRSGSALAPWLHRLTVEAAQARLRARGQGMSDITLDDVLPSLDGDGQHWDPMSDWSHQVDEEPAAGPMAQAVTDAIDALPADYRTSLVLHDVEGMSIADIAALLGITPDTVKSHVHRSRLLVRQRLSAHLV
jgi:RNA polymerase sigma-70 factor, ECF subfamily